MSGRTITAPKSLPYADIRGSGLVYRVNGRVNTFNPSEVSNGLIVGTPAAQFYDRLLDVDPYTYRLMPEPVESWEALNNDVTYRPHLCRDISFQKIDQFTPARKMNTDDVVFALQRVFDYNNLRCNINGSSFPYFDNLQFADDVKSVCKLDNHAAELRLIQPDISFLWHLVTHYASVMSAEHVEKLKKEDRQGQLNHQPVDTGPYQLSEYYVGQHIRSQRHDDFWRGNPLMPQVVMDLDSGGTGRLSKLLIGEYDVLTWSAASQLSTLRDDPRSRLALHPGMNIACLAFDIAKPPLNDPMVRHMLALVINNQRLMQSIYYDTAETAAFILPRVLWAYDNEAKITGYNPEKLYKQLKTLGLENLTLKLWMSIHSQARNSSPLKIAELIQADMTQVGVKVVTVPVEGRLQEARLMDMSHDPTLSDQATDSDDLDSFLRPLLSYAAICSQTNLAHWHDSKFDSVLRKAPSSQQLVAHTGAYDEA